MAEITAQAVKALRDQTGAGMMDCKRVLQDAEGDPKRAAELLRERGLAKAGKRQGRATSQMTREANMMPAQESGPLILLLPWIQRF